MIVTVTANTTLDQTLFVSAFQKNRTMRATDTVQSMGGKPTDASWILGELGIGSLALGFAAGTTGDRVESMLQRAWGHDQLHPRQRRVASERRDHRSFG